MLWTASGIGLLFAYAGALGVVLQMPITQASERMSGFSIVLCSGAVQAVAFVCLFVSAGLPWLVAEVEETRALMGDDPFPYGVARNRKTLETLAGYTFRQGLAPRHLTVEEMFWASLLAT